MRREERMEIGLWLSAHEVRELILEALKARGQVNEGGMSTDIDFLYRLHRDPANGEKRRVLDGAMLRWIEEHRKEA